MSNFTGTASNNTITGTSNDDNIDGGAGNDTINGGGNGTYGDNISISGATTGVTVNLTTGVASDGQGGIDVVSNIEHINGTRFNDRLTGSSATNWFRPGAGDDTVDGMGGKDVVIKPGAGRLVQRQPRRRTEQAPAQALPLEAGADVQIVDMAAPVRIGSEEDAGKAGQAIVIIGQQHPHGGIGRGKALGPHAQPVGGQVLRQPVGAQDMVIGDGPACRMQGGDGRGVGRQGKAKVHRSTIRPASALPQAWRNLCGARALTHINAGAASGAQCCCEGNGHAARRQLDQP